MAHTCQAIAISCMDFRLPPDWVAYLKEHGLFGNCDMVSFAGGVKSLLSPKNPADSDFFLGQIETSVSLHKIQEVIISNHTDCGAYRSAGPFSSFEEECSFHIEEMKKARDLILSKFPSLKVKMVLGKILPGVKVIFEEVKN